MSNGETVFLDTSICIARIIHGPETKKRIHARLSEFNLTTSGLVVRYEFQRRLLREALYLLKQLQKRKSLIAVQRHVVDVLTPFHARKKQITLEMITTLFEGESDTQQTERAKKFLQSLLRTGMLEFDESVDAVTKSCGCACGLTKIRPTRTSFEFDARSCSQHGSRCCILKFLGGKSSLLQLILEKIQSLSSAKQTEELAKIEQFIIDFIRDPTTAQAKNPCDTVGDLLIGLESDGVPNFYTLNGRESQHLARVVGQNLIVCPVNPDHNEIVCSKSDSDWHDFGPNARD